LDRAPKKISILEFSYEIICLQDSQTMETPTCGSKQFFALNSVVIRANFGIRDGSLDIVNQHKHYLGRTRGPIP